MNRKSLKGIALRVPFQNEEFKTIKIGKRAIFLISREVPLQEVVLEFVLFGQDHRWTPLGFDRIWNKCYGITIRSRFWFKFYDLFHRSQKEFA